MPDLYRLIWGPLGRPITYWARDEVRRRPLAWLYGALVAGTALGLALAALWRPREAAMAAAAIYGAMGVGAILGHILWDTRGAYIPRRWRR